MCPQGSRKYGFKSSSRSTTGQGTLSQSAAKCWLKAQHSENEDHGIRSRHFKGNRWGNSGNSVRLQNVMGYKSCLYYFILHLKEIH